MPSERSQVFVDDAPHQEWDEVEETAGALAALGAVGVLLEETFDGGRINAVQVATAEDVKGVAEVLGFLWGEPGAALRLWLL